MELRLMYQLPLGLILAVIVAYAAYRVRALSLSGALAAGVLGTVIFGLGGLAWAVVLLAFFISSSALSRLFGKRKAAAEEKAAKGSRRDAWQVLANGGVAGLCVMAYHLLHLPDSLHGLPLTIPLWAIFCASLAAANADTWATELGVLSRTQPLLITSGKRVEPGTSGAVSRAGTLAALAGAGLIALLGALLQGWVPSLPVVDGWGWSLYGAVLLGGFLGALIDSLLGATVQSIYYCPSCQKETERHPRHTCGTETTRVRGWPWLNNDWVNGACTLSGGILGMVIAILVLILTGGIVAGMGIIPHPPTEKTPEYTSVLGLSSPAFPQGVSIPLEYTCSGSNRSPELDWTTVPPDAKSLVLVVEDPDAPVVTFHHWLLYNIPPSLTHLAAGQPQGEAIPGVGTQGKNDFGHLGYDGPCPPNGKPHRYYFRLYATTVEMNSLQPGLNTAGLLKAIQGSFLAQDFWMGTFQRP